MDIINKIDKLLGDQTSGATTTGNVATNLAKGHVDVIGGVRRGVSSIGYQCPKGQVWDKTTRKCVPSKNESSVVGGSYIAGSTVNIVGSGQTRVWGDRLRWMIDLDRKEPVEEEIPDKAEQNIEMRKGLKFNNILGAYVPQGDTEIEPRYVEGEV